jgi:hypothetical protein
MKKILTAAVFALPLAAFAANPTASASAATAPKTAATAPAVPAASGKNQSDYKAKMAVCQQKAQGLAGEKKQKSVTACMHA